MLVGVVVFAGALASCAGSEPGSALEVEGSLAGRDVGDSSPLRPIELHHEEITQLSLDIANVSDEPVTVAHVRIEGQMLGLIFLSYDTGINETIQPGERRTVAFALDFFDLEGQAHGLLRSELRLFGPEREPLGQTPLVVDGRGSPFATMAVFNLVLAFVALASLAWNLVRLAQRRLPAHRFVRGLRFVHTGVAAGLAVSAALSTLRIWPLSTVTWLVLTAVAGLVAFALGFTAPGPDDEEILIDLVEREASGDVAAFRITRPLPEVGPVVSAPIIEPVGAPQTTDAGGLSEGSVEGSGEGSADGSFHSQPPPFRLPPKPAPPEERPRGPIITD